VYVAYSAPSAFARRATRAVVDHDRKRIASLARLGRVASKGRAHFGIDDEEAHAARLELSRERLEARPVRGEARAVVRVEDEDGRSLGLPDGMLRVVGTQERARRNPRGHGRRAGHERESERGRAFQNHVCTSVQVKPAVASAFSPTAGGFHVRAI